MRAKINLVSTATFGKVNYGFTIWVGKPPLRYGLTNQIAKTKFTFQNYCQNQIYLLAKSDLLTYNFPIYSPLPKLLDPFLAKITESIDFN